MRLKTTMIAFLIAGIPLCWAWVSPAYITDDCGVSSTNKSLKSAGPPPYNASEPPDMTNCTNSACHDGVTGVANIGTAVLNMDLGGAENGYELGKSYTVKVSISKPSINRFGFQLIALQDNDYAISPGTITLLNPQRTQIRDKSNVSWGCCSQQRVWVNHTFDGITPVSSGYNEWTFKWKAPATNVGNITFYVAALEANADFTDTLDYTYTKKKTISYTIGTNGITESEGNSLVKIYSEAESNTYFIESTLPDMERAEIVITDITGKIFQQHFNVDLSVRKSLNLFSFNTGIYIFNIKMGKQQIIKKVFVNNAY